MRGPEVGEGRQSGVTASLRSEAVWYPDTRPTFAWNIATIDSRASRLIAIQDGSEGLASLPVVPSL